MSRSISADSRRSSRARSGTATRRQDCAAAAAARTAASISAGPQSAVTAITSPVDGSSTGTSAVVPTGLPSIRAAS